MWSISEIKSRGKEAFKANYWKSVLVAFILSIFTAGGSAASRGNQPNSGNITDTFNSFSTGEQLAFAGLVVGFVSIAFIISILFRIFLRNPIEVGCYSFFKKNVEENGAEVGVIKEGFGDYLHTFVTLLVRDIFLVLWTCLFVVPGLIKLYSYRLVPYILKDNPELSATEVITKSRQMMNGNKWRAFLLDLSFIGWIILSAITLGIVYVFWTGPYMENTDAALYLELSKQQNSVEY